MTLTFSKRLKYFIPLLVLFFVALYSCKKTFDLEPEATLSSTQVYRNIFDADAAVVGIYGKLMGLAKQYVVLNELRADLTEVTDNADAYLREINTHNIGVNNPYASPKPFYALINDCNDVLMNFNRMLRENKFRQAEYDMRYSDVGAIRSWLYLQLGIHFGQVPYVTDPLETVDAVRDPSKYPLIPFTQLLDSLILFTEALPYKNPYPPGTSLNFTVDATGTSRFFIEKNSFLGDLYLWRGNYTKAATYYRAVMEGAGYFLTAGSAQAYDQFKVRYADVVGNNDLSVGYIRFRESDTRAVVDNNSQGWRSMFARGQDDIWRWEWLWILPFNSNFSPQNPFIELFSTIGGSYLLKPSQAAINNWNSQTQANGFPFDARGNMTWKTISGRPVITKYLYNYLNEFTLVPTNPLQKNGQWFLNRAAAVHLRFAECANRDAKRRLAYGLVNLGIKAAYDTNVNVTGRDVTRLQNSLFELAPYNFDARDGEFPRYRADWYRGAGIRGRARLNPTTVTGDSTLSIENLIINEAALELAYEGHRWPDLLRIALRREATEPSFLANKIADKLLSDNMPEAEAVRTRLKTKANWYLPFKWQ